MMSLKPYISLQQKYLAHTEGMKIYYLGVSISVPNGYVLYQRKPRKKPKTNGEVAQVRFLLFAATSQINSQAQDYLYYFNKSDKTWKNLSSIEVEVLYVEAGDYNGGHYPIYDPFDYSQDSKYSDTDQLKRVGFSKVTVANAAEEEDCIGLLYQEEGLGTEAHIPNMGYPDFPIIDKLARKHIARSVGGGTSGGNKPPVGGGGGSGSGSGG
ncbi:MAG: hypothetical protein AAF696_08250 [Bacteroidota bacterium]